MILAILQARVSSTRLANKVLQPILGRPMLALQLERIARSSRIDKLVIATSTDPSDDAIERFCGEHGLGCFRGSLDDVLDRFYQVAKKYAPEHVVRLTGDCPLADPELIDEVIQFYLEGRYDYASNSLEPTFPDGLDVEVFCFRCLEQAWREAALPSEREHVTPFLYCHPERFRVAGFKGPRDLSKLRWTVDHAEDFDLVRRIYEALYPRNPRFGTAEVLELLDQNEDLKTINLKHIRNEGLAKSLREDEVHRSQGGAIR